jgi:hypothetical protein
MTVTHAVSVAAPGTTAQSPVVLTQERARLDQPGARYQTVGHLYRGIEHGLERLVERHGEAGVFIGPPQAQATTAVFEWSELTAVGQATCLRTSWPVVSNSSGVR